MSAANNAPRDRPEPRREPPGLAAHTATSYVPCPAWCHTTPHPYRHDLAHPGYYRTHTGPSLTLLHTLQLQLVQLETAASDHGPVHLEPPALSLEATSDHAPDDPPPLTTADLRTAAQKLLDLAEHLEQHLEQQPTSTADPEGTNDRNPR